MSSKTQTTATAEEATPALVPKLRFPEFRGAKAWEEKTLGNEGELYSSLTGKAGADFDAGEARFVTYMNVFSNAFVDPNALRFVDVKEGENQNAVASGDVFFTISSETPDEVGMSSVLLEDLENCYLNSFCALFRFYEGKRPNSVFTGYLLRQPLVRGYFTKKAQGSTRFNLSKDAFRNLPLLVPTPAEQQKIAECLSSVDELIAAQARKVDALRTHKKGLMQQLFPREGETQPRLRFPEFKDAGEWKRRKISSLLARVVSPVCVESEEMYREIGIRSHGKGIFHKEPVLGKALGDKRVFRVEERAFVLNIVFAWEQAVAVTSMAEKEMVASHRFPMYKPIERESDIDFIKYFFLTNKGKELLGIASPGGAGRNKTLGQKEFEKLELLCPANVEEQTAIAHSLSSADALVTTESQKLEALKTHKKGLMQQLFPSPEEVEA